jgi:hypothetical protein
LFTHRRSHREREGEGTIRVWPKRHDGDDRIGVEGAMDMRKELVATLKVLVPHLGLQPVDLNSQDDQLRDAA